MAPRLCRGQNNGIWAYGKVGFHKGRIETFIATQALPAIALIAIFVRLNSSRKMEVLQSEYIRFAWSTRPVCTTDHSFLPFKNTNVIHRGWTKRNTGGLPLF